ncbi:MAG: tagaturonate reductase [Clostridiales bacterium]|nr:tagaturonate reductase [Clostridiales bacterium]
MDKLNYAVLKETGYTGYILEKAPEKVMQFGEGNFLRAFVDYWFDLANEKAGWNGKCVLVQPIGGGLAKLINEQEGLYTLHLRGSQNGEKVDDARVISSVSRCLNPYEEEDFEEVMKVAESDDLEIIVSNTTEAGIVYDPACQLSDRPASSFPGKLTQVLLRRYQAGKPGIIMLACELIDNNGKELLKCVNQYIDQWGLEDGFRKYVNEDCTFCGSLVDRIVPGRVRDPKEVAALEEFHGYADPLLDVGEVFGLWVIEGDESLNDVLPFAKAGLKEKVFVTPDMSPYKKRKVRILNGAHTGFVLGAYLAGENIVRDCMHDETIKGFMNKMLYDEVIPTLPLDKDDLLAFASAVQDRFNNPFVDHELMSISLNSTSKWKARNMPSFLEYISLKGELPICLTTSLAAYIAFYSNDIQELTDKNLICRRPAVGKAANLDDLTYAVSDDRWALEFYYEHKNDSEEALVHAVLTNEKMWGQDLSAIAGLEAKVVEILKKIRTEGAKAAYAACL